MTDLHTPGAKDDGEKPRPTLIMEGMPRALNAVINVGTFGAKKYSDGGWLHVPNGHARYTDALYRHLLAEAQGELYDEESCIEHAAHTAWNAMARLELMLRNKPRDTRRDDDAKRFTALGENDGL